MLSLRNCLNDIASEVPAQEASGGPFGAYLDPGCQMAFRRFLEVDFEHCRDLAAKLLSGGFWGSFAALLSPGGQMALRKHLELQCQHVWARVTKSPPRRHREVHFKHFSVLVTNSLSGSLRRFILSICKSWSPMPTQSQTPFFARLILRVPL